MLEGIRIIELEGLGPGPFAAMMLADLGADVIVVHRPSSSHPLMPKENIIDRGKRSIVLDLKNNDDLANMKKLITTADGLIEGFRPGVMEALGLGPEVLHKDHPSLVYGRMTGWGQNGPKAKDAGHDLNYIALSGALWYSSLPGTPPFTPPTLAGDIGGGALYLVAGILAGLLKAQSTGKGTVIDAAIVDGSAHMMNLLMSTQAAGLLSPNRGESFLDGPPWSRCYSCADNEWISVQCLEPKFYAVFIEKIGLKDDPDFNQQMDQSVWPKMTATLEQLFSQYPLKHWQELFENSDACVAPVYRPQESNNHPHIAARDIWFKVNEQLQARPAPRFDDQIQEPKPSPKRGEHTQEILNSIL
jgi:crotonobetainyl-CoA:carnitine CoA-transferase CaiB-like acyl-CoA transferase